MKILIDESVPEKLRLFIDGDHSVVTTWYQGWSGLKNGDGLSLIAAASVCFRLVLEGNGRPGETRCFGMI